MNESTPPPDPESKLTAYLFGETTPAENADIEEQLKTDAELRALMERLRKTIDLIGQAEPFSEIQSGDLPESLQFAPERREALLKTLSTPAASAERRPSKHRIPWYLPLSIAALLMLCLSYLAFTGGPQSLDVATGPASRMYFFDGAKTASAESAQRPGLLASRRERLVEQESQAPTVLMDYESESVRASSDDRFARFGILDNTTQESRELSELRLRGTEAKNNAAPVEWGMQTASGRDLSGDASTDGLETNLAVSRADASTSYFESLQRGEPSIGRTVERGLGLVTGESVQTQPTAPAQGAPSATEYNADLSRLAIKTESLAQRSDPGPRPLARFRSKEPQSADRGRQQLRAEFGGTPPSADKNTNSAGDAGNYSITLSTRAKGIDTDGFGLNEDGAEPAGETDFAYSGTTTGSVPMGTGGMGGGGGMGAGGGLGGGMGGGGAGMRGGVGGGVYGGAAINAPQSANSPTPFGAPSDSYGLNELEGLSDSLAPSTAIVAGLSQESLLGEPLATEGVGQQIQNQTVLAFGDIAIDTPDLNDNPTVSFQRLNREEKFITESLEQSESTWARMDGEAELNLDSKSLGRGFTAPAPTRNFSTAPAPSARPSPRKEDTLARFEKESSLRRSRSRSGSRLSTLDTITPLENKTAEDLGIISELQAKVQVQDLQPASQPAHELAQVTRELADEVALLAIPEQRTMTEEAEPSIQAEFEETVPAPIVLSKQLSEVKKKFAPKRVAGQQLPAIKTAKPESEIRNNRETRRKPAPSSARFTPVQQTVEQATSTFSLNVSDVSFRLAAASLERGVLPEMETIRPEEFFNAMTYNDPVGRSDAPVSVHTERARYPYGMQRELLRIAVRTKSTGRQSSTPLNLVLLLDNSGSMERPDRQTIVRRSMESLLSSLKDTDQVSILTFARTPRLWADGLSPNDALESLNELSRMIPEGGTNLEEAMSAAYAIARKHFKIKGQNRVILLTDGAANLGNTDAETLRDLVSKQRQQGIALDSFGIGWDGYDDQRLEALTRNGDGRYSFLNDLAQVESDFIQKLTGALNVAAKNVKVQITFNPQRVSQYRQIGYAKHQLTKEQFRDNRVDAAELAAEEAGTALYILTVMPEGSGPVGDLAIRYQDPDTLEFHELNWALPYPRPAHELQQASTEIKIATTAALFAERLAGIPYSQSVPYNDLSDLIKTPAEELPMDPTISQLQTMIAQAQRLSGF